MSKKKLATKDKGQEVTIVGSHDKQIPKFCTGVFFSSKDQSQVIITLTYQERPGESSAIVIERVIVDLDHAEKIVKVLQNVIDKMKQHENSTET